MTQPSWKPVTGPPVSIAKAKPKPQAAARISYPPPAVVKRDVPPPLNIAWPPVEGDTRMCLTRVGNDKLTDCGRFIPADRSMTIVTDEILKVTCSFCRWRIERGMTRVNPS